jgi:A/G-specific adenine glycosylase
MLQQTRVDTVVPYYERFMARYPSVHALAEAPLDDVLSAWSGLGYYRRARMLHAAARRVAGELDGAFPRTARELAGIEGIGRYTAGAVASIAFGEAAPLVDGNVARVLARLFAVEDDVASGAGLARVWRLAGDLVAREDPGAWNQALMELGATVCVPRTPRCDACPLREACEAHVRGLAGELPRLAAKARPVPELRVAVVAAHRRRVLLGRRRDELRLGGTWEPPTSPRGAKEVPLDVARRIVAAGSARVEHRGTVVHVLSHRRLEVDVFAVELAARRTPREMSDYQTWAWVPRAEARARATSTFARKVLDCAFAEVATGARRGHRQRR